MHDVRQVIEITGRIPRNGVGSLLHRAGRWNGARCWCRSG